MTPAVPEPPAPAPAPRRRFGWRGNAVLALALLVVGAQVLLRAQAHVVDPGTRVSDRPLVTTTGRLRLVGEGLTVLNFWGEHCPPCRQEAPDLSRVHRTLGARGRVLGIAVDAADLSAARATAERFGMRYPIAVLDRELQDFFGVTILPTTYLIDARGTIRRSFVGLVDKETLDEAIAALGDG